MVNSRSMLDELVESHYRELTNCEILQYECMKLQEMRARVLSGKIQIEDEDERKPHHPLPDPKAKSKLQLVKSRYLCSAQSFGGRGESKSKPAHIHTKTEKNKSRPVKSHRSTAAKKRPPVSDSVSQEEMAILSIDEEYRKEFSVTKTYVTTKKHRKRPPSPIPVNKKPSSNRHLNCQSEPLTFQPTINKPRSVTSANSSTKQTKSYVHYQTQSSENLSKISEAAYTTQRTPSNKEASNRSNPQSPSSNHRQTSPASQRRTSRDKSSASSPQRNASSSSISVSSELQNLDSIRSHKSTFTEPMSDTSLPDDQVNPSTNNRQEIFFSTSIPSDPSQTCHCCEAELNMNSAYKYGPLNLCRHCATKGTQFSIKKVGQSPPNTTKSPTPPMHVTVDTHGMKTLTFPRPVEPYPLPGRYGRPIAPEHFVCSDENGDDMVVIEHILYLDDPDGTGTML